MSAPTRDPSQGLHLCACGCGEPAPIARRACPRRGVRRGDQLRYVSGHNSRRAPDLTRFVVLPSGCHEWTGPRDRKGYGRIQVDGVHRPVHVVVWEQAHGAVPDGLHVDHRCHHEPCMRLECLRLKTPTGNNRCKEVTKLTDAQAAEIRSSDRPVVELARAYSISHQYASDVKAGRRMAPERSAIDLYSRMTRIGDSNSA